MAITSADIHNQSFSIDRKGYDVDEVDVFLEHVADEIDVLNDRIADLESQLSEGYDESYTPVTVTETVVSADDDGAIAELQALLAQKDETIESLQYQLDEKQADGNAIAQALIIAQRSADDILMKANAQATDTIQDAHDEAQRIIERANNDRQMVVDSIVKLQADRENARDEYSDLLKDIIADASRRLANIGGALGIDRDEAISAMDDSAIEILDPADTGVFEEDFSAEVYATPQTSGAVVAAATPVAAAFEKDLSGFGDADDSFEFDEID